MSFNDLKLLAAEKTELYINRVVKSTPEECKINK